MGFLKSVKDRIERENSGGWGKDYENFYSKSLCDRVFSLPLTMDDRYKNVALSGRIYELPTQFQKNAISHLFSGNSSSNTDELSSRTPNDLLADHRALTELFDLKIGLLLTVHWDRASTNRRELIEYDMIFEPILYNFTKHWIAGNYESNRYDRKPYFIFYRQHAFFYEQPGSMKMSKMHVSIEAKFDTKIRFGEKIQGTPLGEIGFSDEYLFGSPEYDFL
jgi:hypothetical protein